MSLSIESLRLLLEGEMSPSIRVELERELRHALAEVEAEMERAAEITEMYRLPTTEELSSVGGVVHFLQRLKVEVGPAVLPGILAPVLQALADLAARSDTLGDPSPGRGPVALCLNRARSHLQTASDLCATAAQPKDVQVFLFAGLGALRAGSSVVGTG